jgi:signal transduction histidine kinase/ActR/RegA family two-component response regulator
MAKNISIQITSSTYMNIFRAIMVLVALLLSLFTEAPFAIIYFGIIFLLLSVFWIFVTLRKWVDEDQHTLWEYVTATADISLISFYTYFTGGLNSFGIVVYFSLTILGSMNVYRRQGLFAAILGSAAYSTIGFLTYSDIIPYIDLLGGSSKTTGLRLVSATVSMSLGNIGTSMIVRHLAIQLYNAKNQAESSSKAKSEFLANMSHEIRTPLNAVIGFTDLLKNTPLNELQQKYVKYANVSGHTLLSILNDILDFSKIEAGMLELESIKTDIIELIENSVDIVNFSASKKNLELLLDIDSSLPRFVEVDPIRLKQILTNLLSNAVKFTETGEVELKVDYKALKGNQGKITFTVRDTGIGISDNQKEKLFKAFSQADSSTTRNFGGTGLGLIISEMIANKMGSTINFVSTQGSGSTFYFEITTRVEDLFSYLSNIQQIEKEVELKHISDSKSTILNRENVKFLVADDVPLNLYLVKVMISNIIPDAKIWEAKNGLEVIELYKNYEPNIILMDVQMPDLDGLEATRLIREIEAITGKHTPIIALTAGVLKEEMQRCIAIGMDEILTKPVKVENLESALSRFIS